MLDIKYVIPRVAGDDIKYNTFCVPTFQKIGGQVINVFDKEGLKEIIFKKYNGAIQNMLMNNAITDECVVIFMHNDVGIIDSLFREKLEILLTEKPDVGLIGVAGAVELTDRGGWWLNDPSKLRGHIIQGKDDNKLGEGFHLVKGSLGYFDNIVAIDGLIMIVRGKLIKEGLRFDETSYVGNDFYDCDFCMSVLEMGYKIAVTDILTYHQSQGMGVFTDSWKNAKDRFIKKWSDKGYILPITANQFKLKEITNNSNSEIVEIEI